MLQGRTLSENLNLLHQNSYFNVEYTYDMMIMTLKKILNIL